MKSDQTLSSQWKFTRFLMLVTFFTVLVSSPSFGTASSIQIIQGSTLGTISAPSTTDEMVNLSNVQAFSKWVYTFSSGNQTIFQFERNPKSCQLNYLKKAMVSNVQTGTAHFIINTLPSGDGIAYFNVVGGGGHSSRFPIFCFAWYKVDGTTGEFSPLSNLTLTDNGGLLLSPDKKFLYIVGKKIMVFSLNSSTGEPTLVTDTAKAYDPLSKGEMGGKNAVISNDGKYMYTSGVGSDNLWRISIHDRNPITGEVGSFRNEYKSTYSGAIGFSYYNLFMPPDSKHLYVLTSEAPSVLYIFKRNAADGSFALSSQQTMASKYLNYTTLGLTFSPDNAGCYYNSNAIGWYTRDVTTGVLSGQAEYKNTYDLSKSDHSMADVCLDSATRGLYTLECASTSVQTRLFVLRAGAFAAVEQSNEASSAIDGISAQPNPFNPATRIFYSLNKSGRVKLELFNVAGTRILTFVNERQAAGRHSAILDARALPSGVYVCRLNAGSRTVSRRIMLVR